jgi:putative nucleotidyltransferase with HDIG domain
MIGQIHREGTATVSETFTTDLLAYLEDGKLELPMLPAVVWEVVELTATDDVDARKLSAVMHRDQALASHVLRVANSPAYRPVVPIVSLQQAVSRLGTTTLGEIAFAVALQSRVFTAPGYEADIRLLWQHAVSTAAFAKEIARRRRNNVEGAFLSGLLHDIGKPVVLQALVDVQKTTGVAIDPAEVSALLEGLHTRVGRLVAEAWALPPHVTESIVYHHDMPAGLTCRETVLITRCADCLSYHMLLPDVWDEDSVRQNPVVAALNLYPDDVDALLGKREVVQRYMAGMM